DVGAGARLEDHHAAGDWVRARILRIEEGEKKVGLTMRGVSQPATGEVAELEKKETAAGGGKPPKRSERPVSASATVSTGQTEALSGTAMAGQLAALKEKAAAAAAPAPVEVEEEAPAEETEAVEETEPAEALEVHAEAEAEEAAPEEAEAESESEEEDEES
ncbi:MAG TPA: hypothetical protein VM599_02475, partial [Thermoanaerobaculia bacterium]|nr:hypothetical protein [Thermoanaerobaculia bacterium]